LLVCRDLLLVALRQPRHVVSGCGRLRCRARRVRRRMGRLADAFVRPHRRVGRGLQPVHPYARARACSSCA